jgi:hypothetical protein
VREMIIILPAMPKDKEGDDDDNSASDAERE